MHHHLNRNHRTPRIAGWATAVSAVVLASLWSPSVLRAADAPADSAVPGATAAAAAATTTQPAAESDTLTTTTDPQATIRQVHGIVQYRTADDQPWQKVTEGLKVDIGVEFRTGPRSSVTFFLPPDQLITLDRLGTLKLLDAIDNKQSSTATTELGMRYGRTRYQVQGAQGVEHQATIHSPSATLAIRGTQDVTFTDQRPGPASASTRGSRVFFRLGNRPQVVFGSKADFSKQTITAGDSSPADYTSKKRIVDPGARNARSQTDVDLLGSLELYNGNQLTQQGIRNITVKQNPPTVPSQDGCGCGGLGQ